MHTATSHTHTHRRCSKNCCMKSRSQCTVHSLRFRLQQKPICDDRGSFLDVVRSGCSGYSWCVLWFCMSVCVCFLIYTLFFMCVVATVFWVFFFFFFEYCLGVMIYLLARRLQRSHCPSQATPTLFALTEINGGDKILYILISRIMDHTK